MQSNSYFGANPAPPTTHPLRRPSEAPSTGFKDAPRVIAGRPSLIETSAAPSPARRQSAFAPTEVMAPAGVRRGSMAPPSAMTDDEGGDLQVQEVVETREQRMHAQLRAFGISDAVAPTQGDGFTQEMSGSRGESLIQARRGLVQCNVRRRKGGLLSRDPTQYHLCSDRISDGVEFFAIKRPHKPTTNYSIATVDGDYERGKAGFVGKVRANFSGTEFVLYDDGSNPKDGGVLRRELAAIIFEPNPLGAVGPRRMKVLLPRLTEDDTPLEFRPPFVTERPSIVLEYETAQKGGRESERIIVIETKQPSWNETLRVYQANFHNRVHVASIKNFQLCDPRNPSRVLLQFGRQDNEGNFALDFQYPFTAIQAFAVALTVFDNKLLAE